MHSADIPSCIKYNKIYMYMINPSHFFKLNVKLMTYQYQMRHCQTSVYLETFHHVFEDHSSADRNAFACFVARMHCDAHSVLHFERKLQQNNNVH
jgi:hypothetical protein